MGEGLAQSLCWANQSRCSSSEWPGREPGDSVSQAKALDLAGSQTPCWVLVEPPFPRLWNGADNGTCQDFPAETTGSLFTQARGEAGSGDSSLLLAKAVVGRGRWGPIQECSGSVDPGAVGERVGFGGALPALDRKAGLPSSPAERVPGWQPWVRALDSLECGSWKWLFEFPSLGNRWPWPHFTDEKNWNTERSSSLPNVRPQVLNTGTSYRISIFWSLCSALHLSPHPYSNSATRPSLGGCSASWGRALDLESEFAFQLAHWPAEEPRANPCVVFSFDTVNWNLLGSQVRDSCFLEDPK